MHELPTGHSIVGLLGQKLLVKQAPEGKEVLGIYLGAVHKDAKIFKVPYMTRKKYVVQGPEFPMLVSKLQPDDILIKELPPMRCVHYAAELPSDVRARIEKAVASRRFAQEVCNAPAGSGFEGEILLKNGKVIGRHIITVGETEIKDLKRLKHGDAIHFYMKTDNPAFASLRLEPPAP